MLRTRIFFFLIVCATPAWVFAENPVVRSGAVPIYLSVFADRQSIGVVDSEFNVPVISGSIGWWGWPGIGFEVEAGSSVTDDNVNNLALDIYSQASLNLRLESAPTEGVAAYALFGVSRTNFDTKFTGDVAGGKKSALRGGRAAFGLTLQAAAQWIVDVSFTHHAYEEEVGINSFRIGLRYEFYRSHGW